MLADIKGPHLDFFGGPTAFQTALVGVYSTYKSSCTSMYLCVLSYCDLRSMFEV